MSIYIKTTSVMAIMAILVMFVGFKFSVEVSNEAMQTNIDETASDAAKLIAVALKDYDELGEMEKIVKDAFDIGAFESVTLYDVSGKMRIQQKQEINTDSLSEGMISLKAKEVSADVMNNGMQNGKIVVRSDISKTFKQLETKVHELMNLFIMMGAGSILILMIVIKLFMRAPKVQ